MASSSRHSSQQSTKAAAAVVMDDDDDDGFHNGDADSSSLGSHPYPPSSPSRLMMKRLSDATSRHLSAPFSATSAKSSPSDCEPTATTPPPPRSNSTLASDDGDPISRFTTADGGATPVSETRDVMASRLPEVGVSQRDYLASLVSLFSDGHLLENYHHALSDDYNSSPLSANTAITAPSFGSSLGPYEYEITSKALYRHPKDSTLCVGRPSIIHPPPEALLEFEMETLPSLERDLQGVVGGYLGQQGVRVTYELRMSGYTGGAGADTVTLSPTVWISYSKSSSSSSSSSSTAAVKTSLSAAAELLRRAVAHVPSLQGRGVEIREGGGRVEPGSDRRIVDVGPAGNDDTESIKLADGARLSVHIEDCEDRPSACGALCCVTIVDGDKGKRQTQSLSRIGGLLKINGKYILGVTTAHGMLDGCGLFRESFDEAPAPTVIQGRGLGRDGDGDGDRGWGQGVVEPDDRDAAMAAEANKAAGWHNVTRDAAVDFLGVSMNSRGEMAINRSKPENATDFALLRLATLPGSIRNRYQPPGSADWVSITTSASARASALDEGPVHILCGGGGGGGDDGETADGQLVWGSACFIVRGRNFRTRRIQTSRPLAANACGSWVVRGEVFYGVIIAVYDNEPLALMMTADRLFGSIMGSAFSIRSVEMWDGETHEIIKTHIEEAERAAAAAAAAVAAGLPRRRPNTASAMKRSPPVRPSRARANTVDYITSIKKQQSQAQQKATRPSTAGNSQANGPPKSSICSIAEDDDERTSGSLEGDFRVAAAAAFASLSGRSDDLPVPRAAEDHGSTQKNESAAETIPSRFAPVTRPGKPARSDSTASDMTMSGAVQADDGDDDDNDQDPSSSTRRGSRMDLDEEDDHVLEKPQGDDDDDDDDDSRRQDGEPPSTRGEQAAAATSSGAPQGPIDLRRGPISLLNKGGGDKGTMSELELHPTTSAQPNAQAVQRRLNAVSVKLETLDKQQKGGPRPKPHYSSSASPPRNESSSRQPNTNKRPSSSSHLRNVLDRTFRRPLSRNAPPSPQTGADSGAAPWGIRNGGLRFLGGHRKTNSEPQAFGFHRSGGGGGDGGGDGGGGGGGGGGSGRSHHPLAMASEAALRLHMFGKRRAATARPR